MKLPNVLSISARDSERKMPIPNLAFVMVLKSLKNDYYIGPALTGTNGVCVFTRHDCERSISAAQNMFVMDYSGDLSDCKPPIEVRLHYPENINTMIRQYRTSPEFWGMPFDNPTELFQSLETAANGLYEPFQKFYSEEELFRNADLEVRVLRKKK